VIAVEAAEANGAAASGDGEPVKAISLAV
jgi:hypothetical protein